MTFPIHTPRSRRGIIGPVLLGVAGVLAGCDQPTASSLVQAPDAIMASGGTTPLGEATVAPTPEGSATGGTAIPFGSVSANTWVIVRITGNLTLEPNQACLEASTPNFPCPTNGYIPPFDPNPYPYGPVEIWRTYGTGQSRLAVRAEGTGAVGLMRFSTPATLTSKLKVSVPMLNRPGENPIPAFFVRGEYKVSAMEIPSPVSLTEGGAGGARQYTLATLYGLQFINITASLPKPHITWRFTPSSGGSTQSLSSCNYKEVCAFTPTVPGRLEAIAQVEGKQAVIEKVVTPGEPPRLELTCPASVTRGKDATCTASVTDGADEWHVTGWKFESPGFERSEQNDSTKWEGKMARGGTVTVSAEVDGQLQTASAEITVINRVGWRERAPAYSFTEIPNGTIASLTLPSKIRWSDDLGSANWYKKEEKETETSIDPIEGFLLQIVGGPNDGLHYFGDDANFYFFGYYVLNSAAMTSGSGFTNAQEPAGSGGSQVGGKNWCPRSVVTGPLPGLVEQHEVHHGTVYLQTITSLFPDAIEYLEQVTGEAGDLYQAYDQKWEVLDDSAFAKSMAIHESTGNPNKITPSDSSGPCALNNEFGEELEPNPGRIRR